MWLPGCTRLVYSHIRSKLTTPLITHKGTGRDSPYHTTALIGYKLDLFVELFFCSLFSVLFLFGLFSLTSGGLYTSSFSVHEELVDLSMSFDP